MLLLLLPLLLLLLFMSRPLITLASSVLLLPVCHFTFACDSLAISLACTIFRFLPLLPLFHMYTSFHLSLARSLSFLLSSFLLSVNVFMNSFIPPHKQKHRQTDMDVDLQSILRHSNAPHLSFYSLSLSLTDGRNNKRNHPRSTIS